MSYTIRRNIIANRQPAPIVTPFKIVISLPISKVLKGRYRLHFIAFHDNKNHVLFDTF